MIQYLDNIHHKDSRNFFLIAGPCAIEDETMALHIAEHIVKLSDQYNIPYILKEVSEKPTEAAWILSQASAMRKRSRSLEK